MRKFTASTLFVAVTTPFYENGDVNYDALVDHLLILQDAKIPGIFLAGTTGEFSALTFEEKQMLLQIARESYEGFIVFNVSSTSLREALELVAVAENEGADAITALPPFYTANAPQKGIEGFLQVIKESTELPLILYHFPRHTQNDITPEMVVAIDPIGVKDSGKQSERITSYKTYLCGGDSSMVSLMSQGAGGVVSVQGNYRPEVIHKLFSLVAQGDPSTRTLQEEVADVSAVFRTENQIAAIKYALSLLIADYPEFVRLPLVQLSEKEKIQIEKIVQTF